MDDNNPWMGRENHLYMMIMLGASAIVIVGWSWGHSVMLAMATVGTVTTLIGTAYLIYHAWNYFRPRR